MNKEELNKYFVKKYGKYTAISFILFIVGFIGCIVTMGNRDISLILYVVSIIGATFLCIIKLLMIIDEIKNNKL